MPKGVHNNHVRGPEHVLYKHGEVRHVDGKRIASPEHRSWTGMKNRCYNPNNQNYDRYGERGITVCRRWRNSFSAFLEDMGRRPTPLHTLERKRNGGSYCKSNCKWATRREQSRNRDYVKLSPSKAAQIRRLYAQGGTTQAEIGERFAVSQAHVSHVVRGTAWREMEVGQ